MIQDGHPHLNQVKTIRYFAIDETDRMVEKGHFEELQNLLEMLNQDETAKKQRQTFVSIFPWIKSTIETERLLSALLSPLRISITCDALEQNEILAQANG